MGRRPLPRAWMAGLLVSALVLAGCSGDARTDAAPQEREPVPATSRARPSPSGPAPRTRPPSAPSPSARMSAGSCPDRVCLHHDLAVWRSVPYTRRLPCGSDTCRLRMDVYAPTGGRNRPVVVLVPGGPNPPDAYGYVNRGAAALADRGLVVMSVGWRQGADWDGGSPESFEDVACAVGVARRTAPAYGGRGDRIVLAGHSLGGWVAAVVALSPDGFPSARCRRTQGPLRPDALVTVAGAVDEVRHKGLGTGYLDPFFGAPQSQRPRRWRAADPFALATARHARPGSMPVTVVKGGRDTTVTPSAARAFHRSLRSAGYRSRLVVDPRAGHDELLTSRLVVTAVATAGGTS